MGASQPLPPNWVRGKKWRMLIAGVKSIEGALTPKHRLTKEIKQDVVSGEMDGGDQECLTKTPSTRSKSRKQKSGEDRLLWIT